MCKILKLITHPITYSNDYVKENSKAKICLTTLLYFILNIVALMLTLIYFRLVDIGEKTCLLNVFNFNLDISYLKIFCMALRISILILAIMYITFYVMNKLMKCKKDALTLFSFTVIMLITVGIGNLVASLLLYLIPGSGILMYYTTFIYYSISMITTSVEFFDIKEHDKFALLWTLVSLCIMVILIILYILCYNNIYNELFMII